MSKKIIILSLILLSCSLAPGLATQSSNIKPSSSINQTATQSRLISSFDDTIPNVNGDSGNRTYNRPYSITTHGVCLKNPSVQASILNTGKKLLLQKDNFGLVYILGACNIFDIHLRTIQGPALNPNGTITFTMAYQYDISKYLNHQYALSSDQNCKAGPNGAMNQKSTLQVHIDVFCDGN